MSEVPLYPPPLHITRESKICGRGTTRAEDAQGTPTQSHISPSILVNEDYSDRKQHDLHPSSAYRCDRVTEQVLQGYLAHKKPPLPLGLPNGPRQMLL